MASHIAGLTENDGGHVGEARHANADDQVWSVLAEEREELRARIACAKEDLPKLRNLFALMRADVHLTQKPN